MESINPMQAMFDGMGAHQQKARAETQLTLGQLIGLLEGLPEERLIKGLGSAHSYRGYYSDLSFSPTEANQTVKEALIMAQKCMGEVFEGWKGGEYQMGRNTPLWSAEEGCTADKLLGLDLTGAVITLVKQPDE